MAEEIDIKLNIKGDSIKAFRDELKKTKKELDETTDSEVAEKLSKSFEKGKDSLVGFNKQVRETTQATQAANKSTTDLNATFEDIYGDTKPLSSRLGELEDRMYEMALAGEANTEEFKDLQREAVKMRKTIIEVDKQVDILADNQGFSVFGDGLADVGASLMRLDFETASKQASSLASAASSISFGAAIKSIKQLGSVFINLGKALLANPLFLIASIVTAIIVGIVKLMDELGLLTAVFEAVGKAIGWVVQKLKDFLDWLGLTNHAEQDAAEKSAKSAERRAKAYEQASNRIIQALDHEIRMAELAGKDTTKLEKKRLERIKNTTKHELAALRKRFWAEKKKGDMDWKELAQLREQVSAKRLQHEKALQDIEYFTAQTKKAREEALKKQKEQEKEALRQQKEQDKAELEAERQKNAEAYEEYKRFRDQRISIEREIQDAELELMEEGFDKEQKQVELQYDRLIEDAKLNEELTQKERARLIELYGQQRVQAEQEIQDKIEAQEKEKEDKRKADQLAEEQRLQEFYAKQDALEIELMEEGYEKQKAQRTAQFEDKIAQLEEQGLLTNEIEKQLAQQLQDDLAAIDQKAKDEQKARDDQELNQKKQLELAKAQMVVDGMQLAANVAELFANKSERAARVAFNVQKAASIAQATIEGYKAVLAAYAQGNTLGGPILGGIQAAIAGGFAAVQITNIAKTKFKEGGSGSGSAALGGGGAGVPQPTMATMGAQQEGTPTPTMNLNEGIQQNAGGATMREKVMVVDYTDIQDKGNELVQIENSFTLA